MTSADLLFIAFVVVFSSATAFGLIGAILLKFAKGVVKRNLEELTLWQTVQTEKLIKLERDIVAHATKIDNYLNEREADSWDGGGRTGRGGTH